MLVAPEMISLRVAALSVKWGTMHLASDNLIRTRLNVVNEIKAIPKGLKKVKMQRLETEF